MAVIPPPHFFRPPTSISSPPRKLRLLCSASEPEKLRTAFAAGGVGGHHIYPAVRIAVEVRALNPDAAAPDAGYEFASISDAIKSLRKLEEFYPQVILNRILTSFVESLFVAYDSIVEYFPVPEKKRKEKCVVSGNSVRQFMRKKFLSREARYSLDLIADDEFASIADAIKSWMKLDSIVDYFPVAKCVVSGNSVRPLLSKRREATKARYSSDLEPEKIRIVFAAGGVGGHIYPAVAIADEVRALNPNVEILFIGTESGIESKAVPAAGYEFASISDTASATLARPVLSLKNIGLPLHLIRSTLKSWKKLEEFDPQVVVGTGGYVSLPTCLAAVLRRVKVVIQEQSSVPGIANRILSVFAESVFVAYDSIVEYFPAAEKRKCVVSGNPVRPLLRKPVPREAAIGRYFPDLDTTSLGSEMKVLLILGGSLGANAINIALERIYRDMLIDHPDWFIIWETGIDTYDEMESLIISHPRLVLRAFLHNMHMAYTAADVVVSRAGAMTCSELMATGKPAILIPSPNEEEGHQFSNASLMADLAGSRMIIEDELDSTTLRLVIEETMGSEYVMSVMSERALQAAKPKAGAEIAEYILSLANSSGK